MSTETGRNLDIVSDTSSDGYDEKKQIGGEGEIDEGEGEGRDGTLRMVVVFVEKGGSGCIILI